MLWFWIAVGLLTAAATASLILPLLRAADRSAPDNRSDENRRIAVYRDRRAEIQGERDAGRLTAAEAQRALDELVEDAAAQLTQAPDDAGVEGESKADKRGAGGAGRNAGGNVRAIAGAVGIAIALPAVALIVYAWLGAPGLIAAPDAALRAQVGERHATEIVGELTARVARNPNDAEGWALLGQANAMKRDYPAAVSAYARAAELLPADARLLADYAEAVALSQGGNFAGKPMELLTRALAADPNESKAVALMAAGLYRMGNLPQALVYMRKLAAGLTPGSDEAQQIAQVIARIEAEIATPGSQASGPGAPGPAAPPTPGPSASNAPQAPAGPFAGGGAGAAPGAQAASAGEVVAGTIAIADELGKQFPPGAKLFVIARAPDGPPIPFAAARLEPAGWPIRFSLGDAQAMNPARLLSTAPSILIEARVSMAGTPARRSGDVFGVSQVVKPGATGISIRIDQRVP
jgi:cytochrome c-type biogenesis protein CcmH